uniref:Uncharacterized protein n=1 Tax=Anguilla anguilla TaxID=7936 RepID=A0A0E9V7S5_ANGAN
MRDTHTTVHFKLRYSATCKILTLKNLLLASSLIYMHQISASSTSSS